MRHVNRKLQLGSLIFCYLHEHLVDLDISKGNKACFHRNSCLPFSPCIPLPQQHYFHYENMKFEVWLALKKVKYTNT